MKCLKCSKKFNARTALCDDWKDPEKSFGCPHCGTFFVGEESGNKKDGLINVILFVGVGLQALNIFLRHQKSNGDLVTLVYSVVILASLLAVFLLSTWPFFKKLKESPHNRRI